MILLFVESPNKTKKIEHILGPGHKVLASVGHIMDLDPKGMSIEIENNFNPIYIINKDKTTVVKNLKSAAKKATQILIATDEDREGEMIAWCIADVLKLKNAKRITFNSITQKDITNAIKNPRQIDNNMVNAQKTRRLLDRLVGYEISPILLRNFGQSNLSAGRVQSVVARLIVDRENEIKKFMSDPLKSYFKFYGTFLSDNKPFVASLYDLEGTNNDGFYKGTHSRIEDPDNARKFLTNCMGSKFKVMHVFDKKKTQGPSPPFTTSTLQQEANRKLGYSGKRTMTSAQRLYEAGYITYMRTDSVNLSEEAIENIKKYVIDTYGNNYYRKVEYKSKTKNTQEAHEAIRPTDVFTTEIEVDGRIGNDEIKLYNLIWKRTVASQMKPAEYNVTSIQISISKESDKFFMTTLENLTFNGFLAVYNIANIESEDNDNELDNENNSNKNIKVPSIGIELDVDNIVGDQDYVRPPGRYNQASLIDKLDPKNLNIGRPATYVSIIEKIIEREYVKVADLPGINVDSSKFTWKSPELVINEDTSKIILGKEKNKYIPTHLGIIVTYYLIKNFPKIMDYKFTAQMEEKLDDIASGDLVWYEVLKEFYNEFHPMVMTIKINKPEIQEKYTKLLGIDPLSGFEIYATLGKYGPIYKMMSKPGKPKIAPIKEPVTLETATLEGGVKAFEYPKVLGKYDKTQILLQTGKFGYYLIHGKKKYTIGDRNEITLNEAIEIIQGKQKGLLTFESGTKIYSIKDGPYGKYVKIYDNKTKKGFNLSLPKDEDVNGLTLDRINEIISAKFKNKIPVKKEPPSVVKKEQPSNKSTVSDKKIIKKKIIKKVPKKNIIVTE
jgi:DNA topoisomerase-1